MDEPPQRQRKLLTKLPKQTSSGTTPTLATPRDSKLSSGNSDSATAADGRTRFSLTQKTNDQLVGPAFDADELISQLDSTSYSTAARYNPSPQVTPILPTSSSFSSLQYTSTTPHLTHANTLDERLLSSSNALLAAPSGHKMDRITPPRSETSSSGTKSPRQRYSDEAAASKPDSAGKKKSMFANFLNGVKGPPRRPTISSPVNPTHVHHVSFDQDTGTLTVCANFFR